MNKQQIETIARACHEANRVWCESHGDMSQAPWEQAPEWQKESAYEGVKGALSGNTPEQSHENWTRHKLKEGWTLGPVKDPDKKEHPCLVRYEDLPSEQKAKDKIFVGTVRLFAEAFGTDQL